MNAVQMYPGRGSFAKGIERAVIKTHQAVKKGPRITLPPYRRQIPIPVDLAVEIWRPVVGYEGRYDVSSKGQVRSLVRLPVRLMKLAPDKKRYVHVGLCINGKQKYAVVHRLVAIAFIPNPLGLPYVNHLDSDPLNNTWPNLEWTTPAGNSAHAVKYGNGGVGKRKTKISKGLGKQVVSNYYHTEVDPRPTIKELSQKYGISPATVQRLLAAHRKTLGVCMRSQELNKAIVSDYINRKANGLKTKDIVAKYGITVFALRQVHARSKKQHSN
ncbi:NUMOD4 domain-containing protein [Spirosoma areae]